MFIRRRQVRFRHIRHFTRFTYQREAWGLSPYVTRPIRFRHLAKAAAK